MLIVFHSHTVIIRVVLAPVVAARTGQYEVYEMIHLCHKLFDFFTHSSRKIRLGEDSGKENQLCGILQSYETKLGEVFF